MKETEQNLNSNEKSKKNHLKIVFIILGSCFVLAIISLGYYASYNKNTHSFSCGFGQTTLPIPDYLQNSQIIFEKPVYFESGLDLGYGCLSVFSQTGQKVNMIDYTNEIPFFNPTPIPERSIFTAYKRLYVACQTVSCMDQNGGGDLLLLKDSQDHIWVAEVKNFSSSTSNISRFVAGYYKNGQRLGNVELKLDSPYYPDTYKDVKWEK